MTIDIGIFGGTFDPVHRGHIEPIREVFSRAGLDQIIYIPSANPPHRKTPGATAMQRLQMVEIAIADIPGFIASDIEIHRQGKSYTVDTVSALQQQYPDANLHLILGLDALLSIDQWHRWQQLLGMIHVIAVVRPGWALPSSLPDWLARRLLSNNDNHYLSGSTSPDKISLMHIHPIDISATQIRRGIQSGDRVQDLLHPDVFQYIQQHKLYVDTN